MHPYSNLFQSLREAFDSSYTPVFFSKPSPVAGPTTRVKTAGTGLNHPLINCSIAVLTTRLSQILGNLFFPSTSPNTTTAFAERFKYDVISSSLLSTSLAASPQPGRRSFISELPGQLRSTSAGDHSRTSSASVDPNDNDYFSQKHYGHANDTGDLRAVVAIISAAVLAFSAGYETLSMLLVAISLFVARAAKPEVHGSNAPAQVCPD